MKIKEPIISEKIRVRNPDNFEVGHNSIVDDFCYFSTKVKIGKFSHIASGCSVAGGKDRSFVLGDYCSLSSGVKIWCSSNDFVNDLVIMNLKDIDVGDKMITGDVTIGNMSGIGSNSVVMPNNNIPEGTVIGALSFVPSNFKFKPWSVYAGIPIKFIKERNRKNVLVQCRRIEQHLDKEK